MNDTELTRRDIARGTAGVGALGLTGFAGCLGGGDGDGSDGEETTEGGSGSDETTSEGTTEGDGGSGATVEVLHGWTGGDGATAAESLTEAWNEAHPDITLDFRPIGGGGNTNLNTVISNRLSNQNPPASFAGWPGENLTKYEGVLGNITDVWEENGYIDAHVDEASNLCKYNGEYRAVPIGSHRLNCLFYNTAVVEEAGINPDDLTSVDAFIDALDTVAEETDKTPMAHGMQAPWTTLQFVAAMLLSTGGYDTYMSVVNGEGGRDAVQTAFEQSKTVLQDYISQDASSIGLTGANQKIISGEAAFIHQGNWAAGAYRNAEDFAYDEDWGFKTFPGTEGQYTLHFDSFIYPSNNPAPDAGKTWEAFAGSKEAQVAFNQYKGSIPTRTDVDMSAFGPYLQETMEDFQNAENKPPTIAHGLAVPPEQLTGLKGVISNNFSGPYNVEAATDAFMSTVQG
ncbi:ABC transporter substrate-binding protein [Candidatus Halobonum tyrrellensis]|uniref:Extracellular solute-binding protein family 1 n=1 Tax=Candidatus Halobonum tyrrellensis G22 TaxID=1324957 RepID=V4HHG1_9EURY|nr:ABC transporter substrate-binding protein [Candidatus Halobonum tyrrellensis]ESP90215.1 extracellular solute-binding protein family 1 [Candidatus Halobonum tyrrellensis G22]